MSIHDVNKEFAKVVFPKFIEDNKNYLLFTFEEKDPDDPDEGVEVQLRSGGALFRDEVGELDMDLIVHYVKGALGVIADEHE